MKNGKLSLADFKAKAEKVSTNELLDKVQGGRLDDCHCCHTSLQSGSVGGGLLATTAP